MNQLYNGLFIAGFINITSFLAYAGIGFSIFLILVIHIFLNRRIRIMDIITMVVIFAFGLLAFAKQMAESKILRYLMIIVLFLYLVFYILYFIYDQLSVHIRRKEVHEQIKNDSYDIYLSLDEFGNILEYSNSLQEITRLTKNELIGKKGWKILFDNLNIETINGNQFISSNAAFFLNHLDEETSKLKFYEFNLDAKIYNEKESTHYLGLVQTHYLKNKKIGSAIYLYKDREQAVNYIKNSLDNVINLYYKHKEVLKILMSLSEGVVLYFDYQEKLYYATQAFMNFVGLEKNAYTFQELYSMISEDDKELYNEQSKTINSVNLTRIKYRLVVKGIEYNAVEDSLYLSKDSNELVSIIHITSRADEITNDGVLSTKEAVELMNELSRSSISKTVDKYDEILQEALKEEKGE